MTNKIPEAGAISEGTMRPQDLIPAFLTELELLNPVAAQKIKDNNSGYKTGGDAWWETENPNWMLDELFDALDECAPEGMYFGALECDGACYGFWHVREET
jgi:hypothetical protein